MRRECRLTKPDLERHLAQGRQAAEIAAETGYTVYQIRAAYRRHGLRPPYQGPNPRCSRQEFIALVTGTTLTLTEIAEKIGVTLPAVSVRARRLGLKTSLSDRGGIARVARKITAEELQAALDAGMRNVDIAQVYGMSGAAIANRKRALREQSQGAL
ncbi:hypothetical protein [Microvirga arabica]|uniref:hypothetical protein n=1 Tax=Microvirga arabica TaxID=1128671 RepID=UPI00193A7EC2|nr:hypothetical protein [Microvirga arabica]MBM1170093.1 hypothetical protein [Microvirga arabica]